MPTTTLTTVRELEDAVVAACQKLRATEDRDAIPDSDIPEDYEVTRWLPDVFTDRGTRGLRVRSSAPKGSCGESRAILGLLRWHTSGGNLDGLFIAQFQAGHNYGKCETISVILRCLTGATTSPAIEAWKRTGLI